MNSGQLDIQFAQLGTATYTEQTSPRKLLELLINNVRSSIAQGTPVPRMLSASSINYQETASTSADVGVFEISAVYSHRTTITPEIALTRGTLSTTFFEPDQEANILWLKEHGHLYRWKWVALFDGKLLGVDESRRKLVEMLGERATTALITKIVS